MKKNIIGIMGGTFDPIHFGHLVIANDVLNLYNMDKIIFIPAGDPPHKKGPEANPWHRYVMTNLATMSNDKFFVSDIEIKKKEKSYTINTIKELYETYDNTDFYFITGTDAIISLPYWYKPKELISMCRFIAVNRPGLSRESSQIKINEIIEQYNAQIEMLDVSMLQISSTDIRQRFRNGFSAKYLLPELVEQYIIKNRLYMEQKYMNIENMKNQLEKSIGSRLYKHCVGTMEEACKLAEIYNVDRNKALIAALLHDCAKSSHYADNKLSHAGEGAVLAQSKYGVTDGDILNAIKYHTTGRKNMTILEKLVFIADKIEPNRNYNGVEELRNIAYRDLDAAVIKSLENTIEYVKQRNLKLDNESVKTLKFLKEEKLEFN